MAAATKPGDFVDFRTCELGSAISCWRHLPDRYSPHTTVSRHGSEQRFTADIIELARQYNGMMRCSECGGAIRNQQSSRKLLPPQTTSVSSRRRCGRGVAILCAIALRATAMNASSSNFFIIVWAPNTHAISRQLRLSPGARRRRRAGCPCLRHLPRERSVRRNPSKKLNCSCDEVFQ